MEGWERKQERWPTHLKLSCCKRNGRISGGGGGVWLGSQIETLHEDIASLKVWAISLHQRHVYSSEKEEFRRFQLPRSLLQDKLRLRWGITPFCSFIITHQGRSVPAVPLERSVWCMFSNRYGIRVVLYKTKGLLMPLLIAGRFPTQQILWFWWGEQPCQGGRILHNSRLTWT